MNEPWPEIPYDPAVCGPWQVDDRTLLRRAKYGGRKGRSAERRLTYREWLQRKRSGWWNQHDGEDYYRPYDWWNFI